MIRATCPFFKKESNKDKDTIYCEGGKLHFPSKKVKKEFLNNYCANETNFGADCCVHKMMQDYYFDEGENVGE